MKENNIPEAIVQKRRPLSPIWLAPFLALLITGFLIYKSISQAGVDITISFKSGAGLKVGKTTLQYKGLVLGKVKDISIGDDLVSVKVHATIEQEAANAIARAGSKFWIVKPRVSASEISGLSTIIGGLYIEVEPSSDDLDEILTKEEQYEFTGLENAPLDSFSSKNMKITLVSDTLGDVNIGTPIFYKKIPVGEVKGTRLWNERVEIVAVINEKYKDLINESSYFWNVGGVEFDFGASGAKLKVESLISVISGGITFETPDSQAKAIEENTRFKLYKKREEIELNRIAIDIKFKDATGVQAGVTPIIYKGITLGKVEKVALNGEAIKVSAHLYNGYKAFAKEQSKFYLVKPIIKNLSVKNLETAFKGTYISLIPGEGAFTKSFVAVEDIEKKEYKNALFLTLKSKKLHNLKVGSPLFYKSIEVGEVLSYDFADKFEHIHIKVAIDEKYKTLVNDTSVFYMLSATLVETKDFDVSVNFEGIKPLLEGGIAFESVEQKAKQSTSRFWLHKSKNAYKEQLEQAKKGKTLSLEVANTVSIKEGMPLLYQSKTIGKVKKVVFKGEKTFVSLFIEERFRHLYTKESLFYKQAAIELKAGLEGIKVRVSSLESVLKGAVVLTNDFKALTTVHQNTLFASFDALPFAKKHIKLYMKHAKELVAGGTKLFYKGIAVGKVTSIKLNKNLQGVTLAAYLYEDFQALANEGSVFYVVKPSFSLEGIKGLETILKGYYIDIQKGEGKPASLFKAHTKKPEVDVLQKGLRIHLEAKNSGSVRKGSYIYYKKIKIGEVLGLDLSKDAKSIIIDAFIYKKYQKLVRKNSKFVNVSGIDINLSLTGAKIKADSIATVINGGVKLITPTKYEEASQEGAHFMLHEKAREEWETYNPSIEL